MPDAILIATIILWEKYFIAIITICKETLMTTTKNPIISKKKILLQIVNAKSHLCCSVNAQTIIIGIRPSVGLQSCRKDASIVWSHMWDLTNQFQNNRSLDLTKVDSTKMWHYTHWSVTARGGIESQSFHTQSEPRPPWTNFMNVIATPILNSQNKATPNHWKSGLACPPLWMQPNPHWVPPTEKLPTLQHLKTSLTLAPILQDINR